MILPALNDAESFRPPLAAAPSSYAPRTNRNTQPTFQQTLERAHTERAGVADRDAAKTLHTPKPAGPAPRSESRADLSSNEDPQRSTNLQQPSSDDRLLTSESRGATHGIEDESGQGDIQQFGVAQLNPPPTNSDSAAGGSIVPADIAPHGATQTPSPVADGQSGSLNGAPLAATPPPHADALPSESGQPALTPRGSHRPTAPPVAASARIDAPPIGPTAIQQNQLLNSERAPAIGNGAHAVAADPDVDRAADRSVQLQSKPAFVGDAQPPSGATALKETSLDPNSATTQQEPRNHSPIGAHAIVRQDNALIAPPLDGISHPNTTDSTSKQSSPEPHNLQRSATAAWQLDAAQLANVADGDAHAQPILNHSRTSAAAAEDFLKFNQPAISGEDRLPPATSRALQVEAAIRLANAAVMPASLDSAGGPVPQLASAPGTTHVPQLPVPQHASFASLLLAQSTPNEAQESAFGSQMVRGLTAMVNQRGGVMTMRLNPPELGDLRVQMTIAKGVVSAQFHSTTVQTHALLESNLPALRSTLESHGLTVERLTVHLPTAGTAQSMARDDGHSNQPNSNGHGHRLGQDHNAAGGESRGRQESHQRDSNHPHSRSYERTADLTTLLNGLERFDWQAELASLST